MSSEKMGDLQVQLAEIESSSIFESNEEKTTLLQEMDVNPMMQRKVLWKIDLFICTNLFLIAFLEFLDKNSLGIAAVYNLRTDCKLVGNQYSTVASIFYFGYLLGEFVCLFVIPKVKIGKFVSVSLFFWGHYLCAWLPVTVLDLWLRLDSYWEFLKPPYYLHSLLSAVLGGRNLNSHCGVPFISTL